MQVLDSTRELVQITVQGPRASSAMKEILRVEVEDLKPLAYRRLGPSIIISRDRTGQTGYDIILPRDESEAVWQGFLLKGGDMGLGPVGVKALEVFRLEIGQPKYGVDVDENTIILEAGYKDAISFTKGCYIGQEVVARATHIGRVNRQLAQIEINSQSPPPTKSRLVSNGEEAGYLTSAVFSPGLGKTVGLAYVNRSFAREEARLEVIYEGSNVPALVTRIV